MLHQQKGNSGNLDGRLKRSVEFVIAVKDSTDGGSFIRADGQFFIRLNIVATAFPLGELS